MIITNSLGSNYSGRDINLLLKLLIQPWKWQRGKNIEVLKGKLGGAAQLYFKGRQAISAALNQLGLKQGDEIIVQAFTCVAVIEPILRMHATPVYVDVAPRSLNPTLPAIKKATTSRTRAVILQHTLGVVNPQTQLIVDWCHKKEIAVIGDLAHSFSAPGFNRLKNTFYILSFSQDKVVDAVSGGALISTTATTNSGSTAPVSVVFRLLLYPLLTKLIRQSYNLGIGKIIHYLAKKIGLLPSPITTPTNLYAMPNALAALAVSQLDHLGHIANQRRQIALIYDKLLRKDLHIITKKDIMLGANLRYPIWVSNRDELEMKLKTSGFYLRDHWYDSPVSPAWVDFNEVGYTLNSCPNAEELTENIFNLPTHVNISREKSIQLAKLVNQHA